jgi:hypothetical protein
VRVGTTPMVRVGWAGVSEREAALGPRERLTLETTTAPSGVHDVCAPFGGLST